MIKDGKLWAHALVDCTIAACKPICKFWGEYLCGSDRVKDINKFKEKNYMWEINTLDFQGAFAWMKGARNRTHSMTIVQASCLSSCHTWRIKAG